MVGYCAFALVTTPTSDKATTLVLKHLLFINTGLCQLWLKINS
jgi:hypothetical protein